MLFLIPSYPCSRQQGRSSCRRPNDGSCWASACAASPLAWMAPASRASSWSRPLQRLRAFSFRPLASPSAAWSEFGPFFLPLRGPQISSPLSLSFYQRLAFWLLQTLMSFFSFEFCCPWACSWAWYLFCERYPVRLPAPSATYQRSQVKERAPSQRHSR